MEPDALRQAVEHAGFAAAGVGLLAGLVFSFNPVVLASIPVSLAYVTRAREKSQAILFGAMFIFGMIITHVMLGVIAGLGGRWAGSLVGRGWGLVLGPLLILLGLTWALFGSESCFCSHLQSGARSPSPLELSPLAGWKICAAFHRTGVFSR